MDAGDRTVLFERGDHLRPGGVKAGAERAGIRAALDDAGRVEKDLGLGLVVRRIAWRIADVEQAEKDRGPARLGCFKVGRDVCRAERVEGLGGDDWRSHISLPVIFTAMCPESPMLPGILIAADIKNYARGRS